LRSGAGREVYKVVRRRMGEKGVDMVRRGEE